MPRKIPVPEGLGNADDPPFLRHKTVGQAVIECVLLDVSPPFSRKTAKNKVWETVPKVAPDVFGICAQLLETSGAFATYCASVTQPGRTSLDPRLWLSNIELLDAKHLGSYWAKGEYYRDLHDELNKRWEALLCYWDWPLAADVYRDQGVEPAWWAHAYFLLIAADRACEKIGFGEAASTYAKTYTAELLLSPSLPDDLEANGNGDFYGASFTAKSTIGFLLDPDVVCVQPKSLVSTVGSSCRVFSRNLCFLRPKGVVRTRFAPQSAASRLDDAKGQLNVLLVPFPYQLTESSFVASNVQLGARDRSFHLDQSWLTPAVLKELENMIVKAENDSGPINGVVFPELSLNANAFRRLSKHARTICKSLEFFLAGVAQGEDNERGNFLWCSIFNHDEGPVSEFTFVQSKHHRWKLDERQVRQYGIGNSLNPGYNWWEHISLKSRELCFVNFRSQSIFSTLICEDLARSDPCHEILRAVGPNIVFSLLMDGPQLRTRWSARYASALAEDPGCTVLTLTSQGMAERSAQVRIEKHRNDQRYSDVTRAKKVKAEKASARVVAYVATPLGDKEVVCDPGSKAVLLHFQSRPSDHDSIDGTRKNCVSWTVGAPVQIG